MNWYTNNAGTAEGPKDDAAMAGLFREKKLSPDSLVWHAGLEAWQTIAQLSPPWLAADAAGEQPGGFIKRMLGFGRRKG